MKKSIVFLFSLVVLVLIVLCSCPSDVGNGGNPNHPTNTADDRPLAKIVIPLPKKTNNSLISKSIGLNTAKYLTNYYEVTFAKKGYAPTTTIANETTTTVDTTTTTTIIFPVTTTIAMNTTTTVPATTTTIAEYGSRSRSSTVYGTDYIYTNYYSAYAYSDNGAIEVSIPVGNYDILLFAGYKYSSNTPILLASSYVLNRDIVLNQTNVIDMILETFDVDIYAPSSVSVATQFNISVEINTKNPLINLSSNRFSLYYSIGDNYYNREGYFNKINNNLYRVTYSLTAPLQVTTGKILLDDSPSFNIIRPFNDNDNISTYWFITSYSGPSSVDSYFNYLRKSINFILNSADIPSVDVNIFWPE